MHWLKTPLESFYGLLGHPVSPTASTLDNRLEDIRESMLELLGETGPARFAQLTRRIRYAGDLQGLWYLRGDLMAALATLEGEVLARQRIQALSNEFRGLLPRGLASRPSSLVG